MSDGPVAPTSSTGSVALSCWEVLPTGPQDHLDPASLPADGWLPAQVPGTVAASARGWPQTAAAWARTRPDDYDWWYRTRFQVPVEAAGRLLLHLDGLATVADVWLNNVHVHSGDNMFRSYTLELARQLRPAGDNELVIRFHALTPLLARSRPRPRWRTQLIREQSLRWYRTTLLGRIPSWSPSAAPVGPWRPVRLEFCAGALLYDVRLGARLVDSTGLVDLSASLMTSPGRTVRRAELSVGDHRTPLTVTGDGVSGRIAVPDARHWMPHTHGVPFRYPVAVRLELDDATVVTRDLGATGFRTVRFLGAGDDFALQVNGVDVFFRGGCWTPVDPVSLRYDQASYREALHQLVEAGGNMVRLSGTMVYESDGFFDLCDELGVAVWQDFMFANMDYPFGDTSFGESATTEARQVLDRLARHPCVAVLCGNSEVSQQAALMGRAPEDWSPPWFEKTLRDLCGQRIADAVYWPSSPAGGPVPVHPAAGDSHYQGVGAYLRDFPDADTSAVRFASETLSMANVPEPGTLDRFLAPGESGVHTPAWKAASPRDRGAGWDFDDVRDEYLRRIFRLDPLQVRYSDAERYLAFARVTTGELMAGVFRTWRGGGTCHGGLIWFWRDLCPGAGWGVVDSLGTPKAAYHYLRRVWRPRNVMLLDRGMNGVDVVVLNEPHLPLSALLRVALYPVGSARPLVVEAPCQLEGHGRRRFPLDRLVGGFRDVNHAYRFGPAAFELVVAALVDDEGRTVADDVFFPLGLPNGRTSVGLTVRAHSSGRCRVLEIETDGFAQSVRVAVQGYTPDDNYFHMAPGSSREVVLRPTGTAEAAMGSVTALNAWTPVTVQLS